MKVLIFWDIYGRIWRKALEKELPGLMKKYSPDFIVANVDNLSSGRWAIEKHLFELEKMWIDIFTSGDHIFDNFSKVEVYLQKTDSKLLRFANLYGNEQKGKWFKIFEKNGKKLLLIHLQWEVFMPHKVDNPFLVTQKIIENLDEEVDGIIIDFHKEVSSEWYGLAHFLDGKVSFIYGTHTHVQTNDEQILAGGTGLLSDVGMNWPKNSVIWATFESVRNRFLSGINKGKIEQSLDKNYQVCAVLVDIENNSCKKIEKIRINHKLS